MRNAQSSLARTFFGCAAWALASRARTLAVAAALSVLLSGGVWSAAQAQDIVQAEIVDVPIQAFAYQPTTITVPAGTVVLWTNLDPVDHTVTDVDQLWDSGIVGQSGTFSMAFDTPGTYTYYCIPHPMMIGTIVVTE